MIERLKPNGARGELAEATFLGAEVDEFERRRNLFRRAWALRLKIKELLAVHEAGLRDAAAAGQGKWSKA